MKTKIHKIIILILSFVIFACSTIKRENVSFKLERQKLLSKEIEMQLPVPFRIQKDNYEEGVIYFYSFVDSAYIIVFQGAMVEFSIDRYQVQTTEVKNQRKISIGIENNKFWRKDVLDGIRIYYDNVSAKNKGIYDKILDEIKITSL
ncbi:MAG: hypothetical protein FWF72_01975 [Paludibacter sp.]|nr:hypothetical protein [Paludibacter sp.]